jgi:hypothetical protein
MIKSGVAIAVMVLSLALGVSVGHLIKSTSSPLSLEPYDALYNPHLDPKLGANLPLITQLSSFRGERFWVTLGPCESCSEHQFNLEQVPQKLRSSVILLSESLGTNNGQKMDHGMRHVYLAAGVYERLNSAWSPRLYVCDGSGALQSLTGPHDLAQSELLKVAP